MTDPPGRAGGSSEQAAPTLHCYRHRDRPTRISCTRCGRPICPDCMRSAAVGFQCPECVSQGRETVRPPRRSTGAVLVARGIGPVTLTLIGLNVALFVVVAIAAGSALHTSGTQLFFDLSMIGPLVDDGQWWRLITAAFLHFSLLHLALNMVALLILGRDLERYFGALRYVAIYAVSLLGGSVSVDLFDPGSQMAGASGAVFGLFGATLVVLIRHRVNPQALLAVLLFNVVLSTLPGISLLAHLGGLVVGAVTGAIFTFLPPRGVVVPGVLVTAVAAVLVGLVALRANGVV